MTVVSSFGLTSAQRESRREAVIRSQWAAIVEPATSSSDFQERWLASSSSIPTPPACLSSTSVSSAATAPTTLYPSTSFTNPPLHKPLRSIHYALRVGALSGPSSQWASHLKEHRAMYATRRRDFLRAPDGSLPTGIDEDARHDGSTLSRNWTVANPLSPVQESLWEKRQASLDLLQTIGTDVSRCLPEVSSLRETSVQRSLSHILFVWALLNPDTGYRQGMHELAGVLWIVREADSVGSKSGEAAQGDRAALDMVLDSAHVEHDTYATFNGLMTQVADLYQWRTGAAEGSGSSSTTPFQPPILLRCANVSAILKRCDPLLAARLSALRIEPQLYLLRWLRLLFLREFPPHVSLELWDLILSAQLGQREEGGKLEQMEWISIALLLRMRNRLLTGDQSVALRALLHPVNEQSEEREETEGEAAKASFRATGSASTTVFGGNVHHIPLLYAQSLALRADPTPQTGVQCVYQNAEWLGIIISPPEPQPPAEEVEEVSRIKGSQVLAPTVPSFSRMSRVTGPHLAADRLPEVLSDLTRNFYSTYASTRPDSIFFATAQRLATTYAPSRRAEHNRDDDSGFPEIGRLEELERRRRQGERSGEIMQVQQQLEIGIVNEKAKEELKLLRERDARLGRMLDGIIQSLADDHTPDHLSFSNDEGADYPDTTQGATKAFATLAALKHIRDALVGCERDFDEAVLQGNFYALQPHAPFKAAGVVTSAASSASSSSVQSTAGPTAALARCPDQSIAEESGERLSQHLPAHALLATTQQISASLTRIKLPPSDGAKPTTPSSASIERAAPVRDTVRHSRLIDVSPQKHMPSDGSKEGDTACGDPLGVL